MVRKADIPRHVVAVALELAATQGWRDTTLADIAAAAKLPLAKVHAHFAQAASILVNRHTDQCFVSRRTGGTEAESFLTQFWQ